MLELGPLVASGGFVGMFSICATLIVMVYRDNRETVSSQAERIVELEADLREADERHALARTDCERRTAWLVGELASRGIPIPSEVWGGDSHGSTR